MSRLVRLSVLSIAGCLFLAPVADASTVEQEGLFVNAAPGEQNNITIVRSGTTITYTDTAGITNAAGMNCVQDTPTQVTCTNVTNSSFFVTAGDLDDTVDLTTNGRVGVSGGDGNDVIDGSKVAAGGNLSGDQGNDTVTGGPGIDNLDAGNVVPGGGSTPANSAGNDRLTAGAGTDFVKAEGGADTVDAGDGDDIISTIGPNASGVLEEDGAADSIVCGGGNDRVTLGQGDQVDADCEILGQFIACPAGGPVCVCDATVTAGSGAAGGALASAAKKKKKKKRRPLILGKSKTRLQPGEMGGITIPLRPGSVNSALGGRTEIGAAMDLSVSSKKKGKRVRRARKKVPFQLKR